MLQINDLTVYMLSDYRKLVGGLTFALNDGDRAVIIGEEGNGKSTLLKLIADPAAAESYVGFSGKITTGGSRLGYLRQELSEEEKLLTPREFLQMADCEPSRLSLALARVGLAAELADGNRPVGTLSGGEKVKLQLARVLAGEPDILLLDEPTNDIDIQTLEWMEKFINSCRCPVLFVSHDETLIENTANVVIHLEQLVHKTRPRHTVAKMGYREYAEGRERQFANTERIAAKQREDYEKQQQRWQRIHDGVEHDLRTNSRQNPAGGRLLKKKMKAVQSQKKRFEREKEEFLEFPICEDAILFKFAEGITLPRGKEILRLRLDELRAGERLLARDIALDVTGPGHIGIIGANGAGKTTLLRQIAESLLARRDINAAYMPQNYADLLPLDESAVEFLSREFGRAEETKIRTQLGSMRFTAEEADGRIGQLSGGQKAKLLFLQMTLHDANVLILDEPTRNFSPLSNPEIRRELSGYGGAIISVSHDRKYLEQVCDSIYELTAEGLKKVR